VSCTRVLHASRRQARAGLPAQAKSRQEQLNALTERYLLRRTKQGTIKEQLPRKVDHIVFCPLAPIQMRAYRRAAPFTRPALKRQQCYQVVKRQRHSDRPICKWSRSDRPQCHRLVTRAPHQ
jgi:hypothetical protein